MRRPKIKIKKGIFQKSIELLTFLLILSSAALIGIYYKKLPDRIPIHFNWPTKTADGFGTKAIILSNPIIFGIITLALYKLNQYPWIFNYPIAINAANAEYNYKKAMQMLRVINLCIALLCFSITLATLLEGLGLENNLSNYLTPFVLIMFIGLPIFYVIRIMMYNKKTQNNEE